MGGMACYAVSLVVWIMALSRVPVSIAYPMLSIGYVVNAVGALGCQTQNFRFESSGVTSWRTKIQ